MSDRYAKIKLPIVEVFESIQGEGIHTGYITTFIRLYQCNLRCSWCDTKYSYLPSKPKEFLTIEEIITKVKEYNQQYICITGGEPLLYRKALPVLIEQLNSIDVVKDIDIETNGSLDLKPFRENRSWENRKLRFCMDYKLNSSNESKYMLASNFALLRECDEIKFVIANEKDFCQALTVINEYYQRGSILLSPVTDSMKPDELVALMLKHKMHNAKLNLQLHKVVWDKNKTGV